MNIRKVILIGCLFMSLPVQAQQFKQFGSVIVNKQVVTHVALEKHGVTIYYGAGTGYDPLCMTTIKYNTAQERKQKFNEIYRWLNEKN